VKLTGSREPYNVFSLLGFVKSSFFPNLLHPIRFIVDTGASYTLLSDTDVITNRIPYGKPPFGPYEVQGISGSARTRHLPNCEILFVTDQTKNYSVEFPFLRIMDRENIDMSTSYPARSLLGLDVLTDLRISFQGDRIILEGDNHSLKVNPYAR